MSTSPISPLRQRMIEDMNARKLCAGTQRGHIRSCKRFAAFLKRSPTRPHLRTSAAAPGRVWREHLHPQPHHDLAAVLVPRDTAAARLAAEIYHLREPQKIPLVMSPDETKRLLAAQSSRRVLSVSLWWGGRGGRPKVKHIDSAHRIIRIEQSKGRKDRNVMLSSEALDLLREW